MDRIVCAAIRFNILNEGVVEQLVVTGVRHYDTLMHKVLSRLDDYYWSCKTLEEQGFVDNRGNFLSREEALEVAYAAKQVRSNKCSPVHKLFSEDLY